MRKNGNCSGLNGEFRKSKGKVKGGKEGRQTPEQPVSTRG